MTMRELLIAFEKFYGEVYTGIILNSMIGYLEGYSEDFYDAAFHVITRRFSRRWGKSPGQAEFEQYMGEILYAMPRPLSLPEPPFDINQDREKKNKILEEIMEILKGNEPMAKTLSKAMEAI